MSLLVLLGVTAWSGAFRHECCSCSGSVRVGMNYEKVWDAIAGAVLGML